MTERYQRIYVLPKTDLYVTGSPVLLRAGALLKDTQTGSMIAQLKFQNIGAKRITAIKVSLRAFDVFGKELEGIPEYQYLDLSVNRDAEFGQKTAIILPNAETRSFTCICENAIFADGTVWTAQSDDWQPLKRKEPLSARFGELAEQYRRDTFARAEFAPETDRDLWLCACDVLNRAEEPACHACGMKRALLEDAANVEQLREHDEAYRRKLAEQAETARIEAERKAAEDRIAAEKAAKKRRKGLAIALPILAVCIAAVVLLFTVILPTIRYNEAQKLYEAGRYDEAITAFESMDGYRESAEQIETCKTAIKDHEYDEAVALYNAGQYEEAIAAFEAMDGYRESAEQIETCKTAIKDREYDKAVALYNSGQYEEAITAFKALDGYKDSKAQIEACHTAIMDQKYEAAITLYHAGNYEEAYPALIALNGYKDSAKKASEIYVAYKSIKLKNAQVGSYVFFGSYEQDNNTSNGKEDIEWLVLAKEKNRALIISRYALDCQEYNTEGYTDVTWETCSLRKRLNGTFISNAFNSDEQAMIRSTKVTADKNPSYSTSPGNDTTDKVFLLSITEVNKYFSSDSARQCKGTDYCYAQGAYKGSNGNCLWWLRSPGRNSHVAAYVSSNGSVDNDGMSGIFGPGVQRGGIAVRPAMWIGFGE